MSDLDHLPPEGRFAARGVAAGLSFDEVAEILRIDGATARKHLRTVVRLTGGNPTGGAAPDNVLRAALAPALLLAMTPPSRRPGLRCPATEIGDALARAALDGPLMLAQAEHAADCPACMKRLVAVRRGQVPAVNHPAGQVGNPQVPGRLLRLDAPLVAGVVVGATIALAYLFLR